jgi:hypothetical protein
MWSTCSSSCRCSAPASCGTSAFQGFKLDSVSLKTPEPRRPLIHLDRWPQRGGTLAEDPLEILPGMVWAGEEDWIVGPVGDQLVAGESEIHDLGLCARMTAAALSEEDPDSHRAAAGPT